MRRNEDTRRKFLIIVRLRGTAQEIYNNLDEATQMNYVQLKTALIDQLDPAAQENRFRTEFRARRQRHGETIAVFGRDIRRLARMAYHSLPLGTRDQLARDQFLDGLANKELRRSVLLSHPKSLDEAIRAAVEFEIASGDKTEPPKQVNSVTGTAKHLPDPVDRLASVLEANLTPRRCVKCWEQSGTSRHHSHQMTVGGALEIKGV